MSEFWKKRRPRLTEDEERALWERVRTMPSEASGRSASVMPSEHRNSASEAPNAVVSCV